MAIEQCELFIKFGADISRVILGHVDIPNDIDYLTKMCSMGFNVQIDHVGRLQAHQEYLKIELIRNLIERGFIEEVFLSGDMGKKCYLQAYGGEPGLGYIPGDFTRQLIAQGFTQGQVDQILEYNPRRVFTINSYH